MSEDEVDIEAEKRKLDETQRLLEEWEKKRNLEREVKTLKEKQEIYLEILKEAMEV